MFCLKSVHGLIFCSNAVTLSFLSVLNTFLESIWNEVLQNGDSIIWLYRQYETKYLSDYLYGQRARKI